MDTDTKREDSHVKMEAEIAVVLQGTPGPLEAERGKEGSSPTVFRGSASLPTIVFWTSVL